MRFLYTCLFTFALPFILLRLYWRGIKAPAYRLRWRERLGYYNIAKLNHTLWVHAVSVGEVEAVVPLIKRLADHHQVLVTTTTPTGSERVKSLLLDRVTHVYLPYDLPFIIKRFFNHFQPKIAIIMEKELWPNLFAQCALQHCPIFIINARLSEHSAKNYQKIPALIKPTLKTVTRVICQTVADQTHFMAIGLPNDKVTVSGNLKFDVKIPSTLVQQGQQLKQSTFAQRFVWIIASTHKGEENIIFAEYAQLKKHIPELLLLVVPRHPERFQDVKLLAKQYHLNTVLRSTAKACTTKTDVYIADTMGELKMLYAAADISFVGGSLVPIGGHNILEPLAINIPVLFGPYMLNFNAITEQVLAQEAALQCHTIEALVKSVIQLYQQPALRKKLIHHGADFIAHNLGATEQTIKQFSPYL